MRTFQVDDVLLRYVVSEDERSGRVLYLAADVSLEHPDVLVYASSEAPRIGVGLPADAIFLTPLAGTLPAQAPLAVRASLASSRRYAEHGPLGMKDAMEAVQRGLAQTADAAEGVRSFVERRQARFTGK